MPELEQLHAGHAPAVLAFELVNRAYFAASVSDRGDEFFEQFPGRHSALLAEQEAFEVLMSRIAGRLTRVEPRHRVRDLVLGPLSSCALEQIKMALERTINQGPEN